LTRQLRHFFVNANGHIATAHDALKELRARLSDFRSGTILRYA